MNSFFGKMIYLFGSFDTASAIPGHHVIPKPELISRIHRLGGTVVSSIDDSVEWVVFSDHHLGENEPGIKEVRDCCSFGVSWPEISKWVEQEELQFDIFPLDVLERFKIIESLDDPMNNHLVYAFRAMASELAELRKKDSGEKTAPVALDEVKVNLEMVSDACLDRYCEISDLDTLFLYEIRKIAREAKRARKSTSAQRWDALLSSPAIRILGQSNVTKNPSESGYAHFGMEIWSIHSGRYYGSEESAYGRDVLTAYADIMIKNNARASEMKITLPADRSGVVKYGEIHGDNIMMSLDTLELDAILQSKTDGEALVLFTSSVKSRGVNTDVRLVLFRE